MKTTLALPAPSKIRSATHRKRLKAAQQQNPHLRYITTHGGHVPVPQPPQVSDPKVGFRWEIYGAPPYSRIWICSAVWQLPERTLTTRTGWVIAQTEATAKKEFLSNARAATPPAPRRAPACINLMPL